LVTHRRDSPSNQRGGESGEITNWGEVGRVYSGLVLREETGGARKDERRRVTKGGPEGG